MEQTKTPKRAERKPEVDIVVPSHSEIESTIAAQVAPQRSRWYHGILNAVVDKFAARTAVDREPVY